MDNVLVSNKISSGEENYKNTLLFTCMMIIRLNHNVKCFQKFKSYDGQIK